MWNTIDTYNYFLEFLVLEIMYMATGCHSLSTEKTWSLILTTKYRPRVAQCISANMILEWDIFITYMGTIEEDNIENNIERRIYTIKKNI